MTTLIHLVSEQTMQNLLPIMALRPARVIQICSARPDVAAHAMRVQDAVCELTQTLHYRDLRPEFSMVNIPESSPSVVATEKAVQQAVAGSAGPPVVNFTGGTKLMSIGAWRAAEAGGCSALYCDTQSRSFVLKRAMPDMPLPPFEQVVKELTVPVALAAHGIKSDRLKFEEPSPELIELANAMLGLWRSHEAEMKDYFEKCRAIVYPEGHLVRKGEVVRAIESGLPLVPSNLVRMIELAESAGLLDRAGDTVRFNVSDALNNDRKTRELAQIYKALEGGWFEVLTYDRMRTSGRFMDVRMNVESREQQSFGENDVVAVDLKRLALTFVSCKNTDNYVQPLEHVFSIRQRATEYGGSHAGVTLCIGKCSDPQKRKMLQQACQAVQAEFIEGEPHFS